MADINDYLNWRADVPFSADPFNEVDNLILSQLAYTDFSGIVPSDGEAVEFSRAQEAFFRSHNREQIQKEKFPIAKYPLLMDGMMTGTRFKNMRLCCYVDVVDAEETTQFSAVSFLLDDGTVFVAYRGTDSSIVGWREDFVFSFLPESGGQQRAVRYLEDVAAKYDCRLRVGGHSKGGNFAVYASAFCGSDVQDRILTVYTNDGPGFKNELIQEDGYQRILPKVCSIVPDSSVIGMLLHSGFEHQVVKSSSIGILQHDGMTWNVNRNRFERTERGDISKIVDESLKAWLHKMDDETRKTFTDIVFSTIEATGADDLHEIRKQKLKSTEMMVNALLSMSKENQTELLRLIGQLIQSGGQTALSQLADALFSKKPEDGSKDKTE